MSSDYSAQKTLVELEAAGWERSDFPIACEECFGTNPYIRMSKATFDKACKLCDRPFTVFRWRANGAPHKTEICASCAKLKNLCQSCLLDLEFGLPAEVRDAGLESLVATPSAPTNTANREWFQQVQEQQMAAGETPWGRQGVVNVVDALGELAPQYSDNRRRVCPFFQRGQCVKGDQCPYLHQQATVESLADQAEARRQAQQAQLQPPADLSVRTLYVGGLRPNAKITAAELQSTFQQLAGGASVESVRLVEAKRCAFVTFGDRAAAEQAVRQYAEAGAKVRNVRLRVAWGLSPHQQHDQKRRKTQRTDAEQQSVLFYDHPAPGTLAPPPGAQFHHHPAPQLNSNSNSNNNNNIINNNNNNNDQPPQHQQLQHATTQAGSASATGQAEGNQLPAAQTAATAAVASKVAQKSFVPPPPPGSGNRRPLPPPPPGQGAAAILYPSQDSRAVGGKRKVVAIE